MYVGVHSRVNLLRFILCMYIQLMSVSCGLFSLLGHRYWYHLTFALAHRSGFLLVKFGFFELPSLIFLVLNSNLGIFPEFLPFSRVTNLT